MNKDFLNWQLTNTLHSIGYNGDTFLWIDDEEDIINDSSVELIGGVKAILYSQAFRWFREKYDLNPSIMYNGVGQWDYTLGGVWSGRIWDSYEEAELACLNKLIEIVESKSE